MPIVHGMRKKGVLAFPTERRNAGARLLRIAGILLPLLAGGCAGGKIPANPDATLFNPEKATNAESYNGQEGGGFRLDPDKMCAPPGIGNFIMPPTPDERAPKASLDMRMRYSPGDRLNIIVPGMDDFSGDFVINADGRIILPFAGEVMALGLTNTELQSRILGAFIKAGVFKANGLRISVRPVQYAPTNVYVNGAVFYPGRAVINNLKDSDKTDKYLTKVGDSPIDRFVSSGIESAGGVRPDADVAHITLIRNGQRYVLNWRGAFTGEPVDDVALISGDTLFVPEAPCFQAGLVRPSQITPPGIRVFMSNLTQPAQNNAGSAISKDTFGLPYGSRFLQGLVAANCVGGSRTSNAARQGVLISRNPKTGRSEVIQRSIEELVRSPDRDALNPHLMPDDAIACYDSSVTEGREILSTLFSAFSAGSTAKGL